MQPVKSTRPKTLVLDSRTEYQFGKILGRGGYGSVYQGLNIYNGDFVAIKQINLGAIPKDQIGGIMTEIDLLKKLKHENIVKYIGYLKTKEYLNIVLEYVENGSLASIVKSMGRFPEPLVRVYIKQVLEGLLYLHEQGVVHRDIKGANILSTKKGHVKLADFGVAQEQIAGTEETNVVVGTPYWMAPEIIELAGASPLSDIWSVGCTVIELVTGDPPYFDLAPMPALFKIVQDDHPPIPPQLSPALKDFLMECFQKDPLLRINAKRLLKHPWIKSQGDITPTLDFENVQENIRTHNEELERSTINLGTGKFIIPHVNKNNNSSNVKSSDKKENETSASASKSNPITKKTSKYQKPKPKPKTVKPSKEDSWDEGSWDDTIKMDVTEIKKTVVKAKTVKKPNNKTRNNPESSKSKKKESRTNKPEKNRKSSHNKKAKKPSVSKKSTPKQNEDNWDDDFDLVPKTKKPSVKSPRKSKKKTSAAPTPKTDEDNWDDDFDIKPKTKKTKAKKSSKQKKKTSTPTPKQNEDNWDDDFDLTPKTKKPSVKSPRKSKKKTSATPTPKPDEDNWDDDFELTPTIKKAPSNLTPKKELNKSDEWDDDDWDEIDTPTIKRTPIKKPVKQKLSDDDNWDDVDLSPPKKQTPNKNNNNNNNDDDWDDFDFTPNTKEDEWDDLGDSNFDSMDFNFSDKLNQIAESQNKISGDTDDFDLIFDDTDFISGSRDKFIALSAEVSHLLACYSADESDECIRTITEELITIFKENPSDKSRLIRQSGAIQILEILETISPSVADCVLQLINQIVEGNNKIQENLCLIGAIPTILEFAEGDCSNEVRIEVAKFIKQVCSGSGLTHQMFIACRGLPYLSSFLKTDNFQEDEDLVLMAIDGIQSVFDLQSTTPKNDFCRLFVKCDTLENLAFALLYSIKDSLMDYAARIIDILLHFSSGDAVVKKAMSDDSKDGILETLFTCLELLRKENNHLLLTDLLKSIKLLSMDTVSLVPLQNINAIPKLVKLFNLPNISTETLNQLVSVLYHLTRIDRTRQELAAKAGIIPHLIKIINTNSPLKQFALEIILDLGKIPSGRIELSKINGIEYYLDLLSNANWRINIFDVLSQWIRDDVNSRNIIAQPDNLAKLVSEFIKSTNQIFVNLVDPVLRIAQSSAVIQKLLSDNKEFVTCILNGLLGSKFENLVRLKLMKILVILCDSQSDFTNFSNTHNLPSIIDKLKEDSSILIVELAQQLSQKLK